MIGSPKVMTLPDHPLSEAKNLIPQESVGLPLNRTLYARNEILRFAQNDNFMLGFRTRTDFIHEPHVLRFTFRASFVIRNS